MPLNMRLKLSALCLAALALAGCDLPMEPTAAPASNQSPMSALSAEMPRDARTMARSFVEVVERVTPVAEQECRARSPRMNCDFQIFVDDRAGLPANAFQTVDARGRPIIVFTISLIADARNADELAFVLAHEAAHHIEGHLDRQRRNATMGAVVFGGLAGATGGDPQAIRTAQELGAAVGARSYSREFELEADRLGAIIAFRGGYDPMRGAEFFFRVPDPDSRFFSTHPPNAERFAAVQRVMAGLR